MSRGVVVGVQRSELAQAWPFASSVLKPAFERSRGELSSESVADNLLAERCQLFLLVRDGVPDSAMVTAVEQRASGRTVLFILAAGGVNARGWLEWLPALERWAASHGCDEIYFDGRKGWARMLRGAGFAEASRRYAKRIQTEEAA